MSNFQIMANPLYPYPSEIHHRDIFKTNLRIKIKENTKYDIRTDRWRD